MTTSLDLQTGGDFDKVRLLHSILVEKCVPLSITVKYDDYHGTVIVLFTSLKKTIQEKVALQRELSKINIVGELSGYRVTEHYRQTNKTYVYMKRKYFDDLFSTYSLMDMEANEIDFLLGTDQKIFNHLVDIVEVDQSALPNPRTYVGDPFVKTEPGPLIHYRITFYLEYRDFESNYETLKTILTSGF